MYSYDPLVDMFFKEAIRCSRSRHRAYVLACACTCRTQRAPHACHNSTIDINTGGILRVDLHVKLGLTLAHIVVFSSYHPSYRLLKTSNEETSDFIFLNIPFQKNFLAQYIFYKWRDIRFSVIRREIYKIKCNVFRRRSSYRTIWLLWFIYHDTLFVQKIFLRILY